GAAASRRFCARCIPLVGAMFVAGALALLGADERRDRQAARAADRLSAQLVLYRSAGDGALRTLGELTALQHESTWTDLEVMALVGGAALLALLVAARREKSACLRDAAFVSRLAERNADLDAFAGRLAHDLRNPLSPILLGVQRIERADLPPEVRAPAAGVERSARRLLDMIEVVLDFTRADAPTAAAELPPVDVAQVVDEALGFFHERARARGVRFEVAIERGLGVRCETAILSSVMQNLIDNALKYGCPRERCAVYVRGRRAAPHALIEVEDEGGGIAPEVAERVFEPRFQERRGRGLGLGLATVKRLLAGRAGSIELGRGAVGGALFRVRLVG